MIEADNPIYDNLEVCVVRGGLLHLRWYTKSYRFVKPDRRAHQLTEVPLGNIDCNAPPNDFAVDRPPRPA